MGSSAEGELGLWCTSGNWSELGETYLQPDVMQEEEESSWTAEANGRPQLRRMVGLCLEMLLLHMRYSSDVRDI